MIIEHSGIEVDRCTRCFGLFFDRLEADDLRKFEGAESIDIGDEFAGSQYDRIRAIDCPRCEIPMREVANDDGHVITFESCPDCSGIWFDAGEFRDYLEEEIVEQFRDVLAHLE